MVYLFAAKHAKGGGDRGGQYQNIIGHPRLLMDIRVSGSKPRVMLSSHLVFSRHGEGVR